MAKDEMVLATQAWLNKTYGEYVASGRFKTITENGIIGWATINGLIRALQIELGIQATADNFGTGTVNAFKNHGPITRQDGVCKHIFGIVQGALWCKGYNTGHYAVYNQELGKYIIDESFDEKVEAAVTKMQKDAGRLSNYGEVDLNTIKALLSMDYFVTYRTDSRSKNIRSIQQYLNGHYEPYIGLKPCDGVYGRGTSTALLYALQAEEKLPIGTANGFLGKTTKAKCPAIPYDNVATDYNGNKYTNTIISNMVKIVRMALYVNGFEESNGFQISGTYDDSLSSLVRAFQKFYALPESGKIDRYTWGSLLISCGDQDRPALACDCATILTEAKAKTLYDAGYRYVGRYLAGTDASGNNKGLSQHEFEIAFRNGLRIFPISQGSGNKVAYFTEKQGENDAKYSYNKVIELGIPQNSIIYFAVDCDPTDPEITNYIIPYFKKVHEYISSQEKKYQIGIYGTRNTCTRVCAKSYAVASFVSDMAYGFSGNLGFKIPDNWAFDQFTGATVGTGDGKIVIDKDGFSGLDLGVSYITYPQDSTYTGYDTLREHPEVKINFNRKIPVYSAKAPLEGNELANSVIEELKEELGIVNGGPANYGVSGELIGYINPGDFYIRYKVRCYDEGLVPSPDVHIYNEGDSTHKVIFRDSFGNVRKGYIQEMMYAENYNNGESRLPGQYYFRDYNYDEASNSLVNSPTFESIFTVKRKLKYLSPDGEVLGYLNVGDKIKTNSTYTGQTYHTYLHFTSIYNSNTDTWEPVCNSSKGTHGFIDLDMANGVKGSSRALW